MQTAKSWALISYDWEWEKMKKRKQTHIVTATPKGFYRGGWGQLMLLLFLAVANRGRWNSSIAQHLKEQLTQRHNKTSLTSPSESSGATAWLFERPAVVHSNGVSGRRLFMLTAPKTIEFTKQTFQALQQILSFLLCFGFFSQKEETYSNKVCEWSYMVSNIWDTEGRKIH